MLFDLRGRGRRNTVKIVYIALAFLMGGGLVLFGIGGATSGGLVDAITGNGSSGDTGADRFKKQVTASQARLRTNPKDEKAWTELIRAQVNLAGTGDKYDSATNQYTKAGKADLQDALASWEKYLAINPKDKAEEARVASRVVQAYAALEDLEGLVAAQEVVAAERNAVGPYAALAQYAYLAGQTRKGDLACQKAVELEDPDQREQLKGDCKSYKDQGPIASPTPADGVQVVPNTGTGKKAKKPKSSK
jgi:tetratricopeptide (TPR) repeat protein